MMKKIKIEGMSTGISVNNVKDVLASLNNSGNIQVSLEGKYGMVGTLSSNQEIKEKIEYEGYNVVSIENM
ncbi:heavy-metal-associated domain-containing protein [Clostridium gasigenes]|uniref:Copper chaperone CopZ n=2 Tax=Clostridium gasigenes TaxID=94869 RepID=A0A1H0MNZ0_9CLOT|nr:heavy-metal-associated domain-containing protein [Clostridium gasigenes]MBB6622002.1 heavy-metal-associated domain-containing protein [Clostridium gasigenes]MBU3086896.1 heavy-metal-associated domain-containing protein [Clostridium gasigenes]MBU3102680.1 heavy-metal-associated domain-containing protein [Clostridium gasigenes]MBU3106396.1 heavy-metal-associated domain-containing protein [Clostridium gasigenes]MBU3131291.1 heavy-metal-associated domain-containing protein [Clostridium gasigene